MNGGMRNAFPLLDQWSLLTARGFTTRFSGLWVQNDDPEEVALQLRADPESRLECDLDTAMRWYEPYSEHEIFWIGPHSPGWTHVLSISGSYLEEHVLSREGRSVFRVEYDRDVDGIHDLDHFRDGAFVEAIGPMHDGETRPGSVLGEYQAGLEFPGDKRSLSAFLTLVGRITGRFIDQVWLTETRALYRIPDDAWM